jgi:hypothetical protein
MKLATVGETGVEALRLARLGTQRWRRVKRRPFSPIILCVPPVQSGLMDQF